jgi:hypothetical protein
MRLYTYITLKEVLCLKFLIQTKLFDTKYQIRNPGMYVYILVRNRPQASVYFRYLCQSLQKIRPGQWTGNLIKIGPFLICYMYLGMWVFH